MSAPCGADRLASQELTMRLRSWGSLRFSIGEGETMSDTAGIAGNRIRSFVERIEQLEAEIQELNESKKEVFAEAKGEGFDVKILKEIIKILKQDQDERDEHETLLDVYMRAMESTASGPEAKAA
jgi:uncharacterized protein (UPF0335 family)